MKNKSSASHSRLRVFASLAILFIAVGLSHPVASQQLDSLRVIQPDSSAFDVPNTHSTWSSPPPSGQSEKLQGGLLILSGGVVTALGVLKLKEDDPCADFNSRSSFCLSNIEEVHAVGAVQVGLGVVTFLFGVARQSAGLRKARAYAKWKRNNLSVSPVFQHKGHQTKVGIELSF